MPSVAARLVERDGEAGSLLLRIHGVPGGGGERTGKSALRVQRRGPMIEDVLLFPGSPAPAAQVRAPGRGAVDLAGLAGAGPALLFFYKGDCATSDVAAHALPRLAAVAGLTVVAVSQDGEAETHAFAARHALREPVRLLVDPEPWAASDAYGIRATPTWVLLARGGRVEAVAEGWSRDQANSLAARAAGLAGAPAPVVSTPADGPAFRPG